MYKQWYGSGYQAKQTGLTLAVAALEFSYVPQLSGRKLAMNENECEGIACKFSALHSISLSYFHPFFLKGWAKVSQVLIFRNFGLDLWRRGGVSYFDKCRSSLRTASVPLLSWIKGVVAFQ